MRKNDLIKILQELKGNPEIMIWNGFVEDVMKVKGVTEANLVTYRQEWVEKYFPEAANKRPEWTLECGLEEEDSHKKKRILVLESKQAGKSTWDRLGSMSY